MKWLQWKNLSINEQNIYFSNNNKPQKNLNESNFQGISYFTNNINLIKYYRNEQKKINCCYLQFNIDNFNNSLESLTFKQQFNQQSNIEESKTTDKLSKINNNVNEILFKKQSKNQNILINKFNNTSNKNIEILNINYSNFFEQCYKYKFICLDLINTPNIILSKLNVLDFLYKCYLINSIPLFITKSNIENIIKNNFNKNIELPFISVNSFDNLINGFISNGNTSNEALNINIQFKYINEICKRDYNLDYLIYKKIYINDIIKQEKQQPIDKELLQKKEELNYFNSQLYSSIDYDNIYLNTSNTTNTFIKIIYYLMKYYNNELKPRFFIDNNESSNDLLSLFDLMKSYNINIPLFTMKEEYNTKFKFIDNSNKDELTSKINYIFNNKNNIQKDKVLNYLLPTQLNNDYQNIINNIKNKVNSNHIVGIHLYHNNRYNANKLNKYIFLNEVYYILAIDNFIKSYLNKYMENLKSSSNIELPKIHFLLFTPKDSINVSQLIMNSIKNGYKSKITIDFTHINQHNQLLNNGNNRFLNDMFLLSHCDSIITSNTLFSLLTMLFTSSNDIYYPKKWLKDNILNENFIMNFDKQWNSI